MLKTRMEWPRIEVPDWLALPAWVSRLPVLSLGLVVVWLVVNLIVQVGFASHGQNVERKLREAVSFVIHNPVVEVDGAGLSRSGVARLAALVCVVVAFGLATPYAVGLFASSATVLRIAVAVAILLPLGFLLGMPFPLGMKLAAERSGALAPWLWGVNGATSVCASVLAAVIALSWGISASFWAGLVCYLVALGAFVWAVRRRAR